MVPTADGLLRWIIFESGKPLADGSIAGNDTDPPGAFEPHYDVITDTDQVQIYESVMLNSENAVFYTLLRGSVYAKDNRLLPPGSIKLLHRRTSP